jgi:hypothetical protein
MATRKKIDLQAQLTKMNKREIPPPREIPPQSEVTTTKRDQTETKQTKPQQPKYRAGKTQIAGFFDPAVSYQLRDLETKLSRERETRITRQELLAQALNLLFEANGMPRIA